VTDVGPAEPLDEYTTVPLGAGHARYI